MKDFGIVCADANMAVVAEPPGCVYAVADQGLASKRQDVFAGQPFGSAPGGYYEQSILKFHSRLEFSRG